jgi:uncharacterized protein (TIGR02117 family)
MSGTRLLALFLLLVSAPGACATAPPEAPAAPDRPHTIYVVSHGWHTGIVIRKAEVAPGAWPEADDFPNVEFLEVGWGDRAYYQKPDPGVGDALAAVLVPGPSVLHVVGFRGSVRATFPASEAIALRLTPAQLARLVAHVRASYERDATGQVVPLGRGLYGDSRFYAAVGRFHLFQNCNVWTAQALQAAGLPVATDLTAGGVMRAVRAASAAR